MIKPLLLSVVIGMVSGSVSLAAQTPVASAAGQPAEAPDAQAPPVPAPNYAYSSDGRRDPFQSLVNRGVTDVGPSRRPEGVPGLAVEEIVVRGILKTPAGFVAMVQSPNGRTYTVRPGDQLFDGRVRAITAEALVMMQEVNDPLSLEKQREVRKPLRGGAEG